MSLILRNDNVELTIDLSESVGRSPHLRIKDIYGEGEKNFILNPDQIHHLTNYLTSNSIPYLAKWLKSEGREIVKKEDLEDMLECVKACCNQANRTANAAIESANRLSEIYQRYLNSVSKEDENEDKT